MDVVEIAVKERAMQEEWEWVTAKHFSIEDIVDMLKQLHWNNFEIVGFFKRNKINNVLS